MVADSGLVFTGQACGQCLVRGDVTDILPPPGVDLGAKLAFVDQIKIKIAQRKVFRCETDK